MLYETQPLDPITFAGVTGLLAGAGLIAFYVSARRAVRLDQLAALREDQRRMAPRDMPLGIEE
jgi:hypothetical protein